MKVLATRSSIWVVHGACASSRSTCSPGADAITPLPAFTRAAKATRRIKFDRNKSVEADLTFWANFLGRGSETMNVGDLHVDDLLIDMTFLTVEVPEIGLSNDAEHKNRMSA